MNSEDLQHDAKTVTVKLTMWLKAVAGLFWATWPLSGAVVAVVVIGLYVAYLNYHGTSENEQAAEDARTSTTVQDADTDVQSNRVANAEKDVKRAEQSSNQAKKDRDRAKNTNTRNTSFEQANAERCRTFPESEECRK